MYLLGLSFLLIPLFSVLSLVSVLIGIVSLMKLSTPDIGVDRVAIYC